MTKEWQEASTEMAKEQKINPITGKSRLGTRSNVRHGSLIIQPRHVHTGLSSEGYAGKGLVSV
jgi:hypothetical protein